MRILFIVPWGERLGGSEVMLQTVLEASAGSDHELELAFLEDGSWPRELEQGGFAVEVIEAGRLRRLHQSARCVLALSRLMRRRSPDVIVNWIGKAQLYGAPAAALAGMSGRVVWWQHEISTAHWIDRIATVLPAAAVGCSSAAAARAQADLRPRRRTFVVAPGTSDPRTGGETAPTGAPTGPPVVGIVGRLQPWKGQDRLLEAQALLRERGVDMRLLIVGGDAHGLSSEYAASLPRLVSRLGLEDAVTMTGQVPDPAEWIEQMDVLVNASDPEPFGLVLLEGMAHAKAVLAVASGGPLEIVQDGRTGVLATSGEPEALADALEPLLGDPELRGRLGQAGRERFERQFTASAMCGRLFAELEQLRPGAPVDSPAPPVTIVAHDIGHVGGMERQLVHLIMGLRELGHQVDVIARRCELPEGSGVRFHRVPGPGRPFIIAYPWFLMAGTVAVMLRRRGVVQATGAIVLNQVDVIGVHYCHQEGPATPSRASRPSRLYIRGVAQLNKVCERLCYGAARRALFVCVSDGVADEMRRFFPRAASRVRTIHNGVDLDAFAPGARREEARELRGSLGVGDGVPLAAFVGSEWERKGLEFAVRALAGAPGWGLLVAGDGDREHYERIADSLGVGQRIHWLGVTRDVPLALAASDALVFPSTYEAFPLVALEAAAAGLPILATPVNGVRELIRDGESGFLIERDAGSIAAALRRLGDDPELRLRVGSAAREAVAAFSWARMIARHHDLYVELAAGRVPSVL